MGEREFAGERLGLGPLDVRTGLENGSLPRIALNRAWSRVGSNPMAPENSEPHYTAMGSVQPEVTFGV